MSLDKIEKKFIQFQLQTPPYTIEEIEYLINTDDDLDEKMTFAEVEKWISLTKDKARLQKKINEKKSKRKSVMLINDMNDLINELKKIINNMNREESGKTIISAIKELRLTTMDIARLAGELQKQQEIDVNQFYVPINKMEEYFQKRLKKFLEKSGK